MDALSNVVSSALDWVWRASWQASVLAGIVLFLRYLLRRHLPSRWRHLLWYAVIARLALPVSLESPISVFNLFHRNGAAAIDLEEAIVDPAPLADWPASAAARTLTIGAGDDRQMAVDPQPRPAGTIFREPLPGQGRPMLRLLLRGPLMAWAWFCGTLTLIGWTLQANNRLLRSLRSRPTVTDLRLLRILGECKRSLGVRKHLRLVQSHDISSPALYGLLDPILILPADLRVRLDEAAIRHVMLHELCHLRRRDIAANWLTSFLQAIHWFNPLVWHAIARYRTDREMARDAEVVQCLGTSNAVAYARTVVRLARPGEDGNQRASVPGLAGISEDGMSLRGRISAILRTSQIRTAGMGLWCLAFLILMTVSLTDAKNAAPSSDLRTGSRLVLRVVDSNSGDPIALADIRAGNCSTHTDGGGHGRIRLNDNALVAIRAEGYVPAGFRISELDGCWLDACTLELQKGLSVGGILRDETGAPVSDASIVLETTKVGTQGPYDLVGLGTWSTVRGPDGRWRCGSLPPDLTGLLVRIRHPMFRDATLHAVSPKAGHKPSGAIQLVEQQELISGNTTTILHRGISIAGLVLDAAGNPVAGARVWQEEEAKARQPVSVLTSAAGTFRLSNASGKATRLTVEAPGYIPQTRLVGRSSPAGSLRFYLARGYSLRGRVTDETGAGIPGALVRVETGELQRLLQTDVLGRFSWDSAPGRVTLRAGAQGFESSEAIAIAVSGQEHQIRLSQPRRLTIVGRVIDSQTNQPLPRFRVVAGWTQTLRTVGSFLAFGQEGRFLLTVDDPVLPRERLSLRFEAPGYLLRHAVILPATEPEMTVKLTMAAAPALTGRIATPSGLPVAGARVWVLDRLFDFVQRAEWDRGFGGKAEVLSDSGGQFKLHLSADQGHIVAFHPELGIGKAPVQEFLRSRQVTLRPWGTIEGELRVGQSLGVEQPVILRSLLWEGTACTGWIERTAETSGEGSFRFDRLPPGEYRLARLHGRDEGGFGHAGQFLAVAVRPGETRTVSLGGRGYKVTGRILLAGTSGPIPWNSERQSLDRVGGAPDASVSQGQSAGENRKGFYIGEKHRNKLTSLRQPYIVEIDPDGTFRIEDVLPGTYDLRIQTPELMTISKRIVIPPLPSGRDNGEMHLGAVTIR